MSGILFGLVAAWMIAFLMVGVSLAWLCLVLLLKMLDWCLELRFLNGFDADMVILLMFTDTPLCVPGRSGLVF